MFEEHWLSEAFFAFRTEPFDAGNAYGVRRGNAKWDSVPSGRIVDLHSRRDAVRSALVGMLSQSFVALLLRLCSRTAPTRRRTEGLRRGG